VSCIGGRFVDFLGDVDREQWYFLLQMVLTTELIGDVVHAMMGSVYALSVE
jgi:hypothetical protein